MKSVAWSALVVLLLALPLAGLVAGYAHALGAGPLVEVVSFAGMAVLLLVTGIKAIRNADNGGKIPRMAHKD